MRVFTKDEVMNEGHTVVLGHVINLKKYNQHHRGGRFLHLFEGKDMTMPFLGAHISSDKAHKHIQGLSLGSIDSPLSQRDQELYELHNKYLKQGLFEADYKHIIFSLIRAFTFFFLGLLLYKYSEVISVLFLTAGTLDIAWQIHNAGHFSVFKSNKANLSFIETLGILILGTSQEFYHLVDHRIHHGTTNTLGFDGAVKVGRIIWNKKQMNFQTKIYPFFLQPVIWFLGILPLTYPALLLVGFLSCLFRKKLVRSLLILLRWVGVYLLFDGNLSIILLPLIIAGYLLAFVASLNHFHLDMDEKLESDFSAQVFNRTQNMKENNFFMNWITGDLNLHIEHHIFPTMPPRNYKLIQNDIKDFAKRHNLVYRENSFIECSKKLISKLSNPLETKLFMVKFFESLKT